MELCRKQHIVCTLPDNGVSNRYFRFGEWHSTIDRRGITIHRHRGFVQWF
jgi:hypothetical protein